MCATTSPRTDEAASASRNVGKCCSGQGYRRQRVQPRPGHRAVRCSTTGSIAGTRRVSDHGGTVFPWFGDSGVFELSELTIAAGDTAAVWQGLIHCLCGQPDYLKSEAEAEHWIWPGSLGSYTAARGRRTTRFPVHTPGNPRLQRQLREVPKPAPQARKRSLQLTQCHRSTLLQARDIVRHGEVGNDCGRRAHPRDVSRLIINH
jgi:hypothetical protein